jgi:periplasmic protein TonB
MSRPAPPLLTAPSPPPSLRLPRPHRRPGGTAVSVLLHGAVLLALAWRGAQLLGGGEGPGPRGGGGGGGGAVHYVTLPAPAAPRALDVPVPPRVTAVDLPIPDPVAIKLPALETPAVTPPAAATVTGTGAGAGPGSGPGTGGGQGAGTGPGTGSDVGPGTGGAGSYILRADPRALLYPPECAKGKFNVRFWVEADGHVSRVEVEPLPKDAGCRREFVDKMKSYQFRPAHTPDGQAVASVYPIQISR